MSENNCSCNILKEKKDYYSLEKLSDTTGKFPGVENQFLVKKIDEIIEYIHSNYKGLILVAKGSGRVSTSISSDYKQIYINMKGEEYFYSPENYIILLAHELKHAKRLGDVVVKLHNNPELDPPVEILKVMGDRNLNYDIYTEGEIIAHEAIIPTLTFFGLPYDKAEIDNLVAIEKNRLEIYQMGSFESNSEYLRFLRTIVPISDDIKSYLERDKLYQKAERKFALLNDND